MQINKLVQIQDEPPCSHFFTYKGKEYPFNIDFFRCYSKYFSNNQFEAQFENRIPILDDKTDDKINLSEESIQYFIKFIHRQQISINNENVIFLNYLATKYEVSLLINATNDYISTYRKELALQLLLLYQNNSKYHPEQYEYIVSTNLLDYLDDERLFSLKISMLHRIVDRFLIEKNNSNKIDKSEDNDKLIKFLFKCIEKFGPSASVLFMNVDFGNIKIDDLNHLIIDLEGQFDFHFANLSFLKTIYQTQSDLLRQLEKSRIDYQELEKKMEIKFNEIESQHSKQLNEQKKQYEIELSDLKNSIEQIRNVQNQQLSDQKKEIEQLKLNVDQLIEQKTKLDDEIKNIREQVKMDDKKTTFDESINQLKNKIDQISKIQCKRQIFGQLKLMANESNIIDSGLIGIETSSVDAGSVYDLFDNSADSNFRLGPGENVYILFDFKDKNVHISQYHFITPSKKTGNFLGWPKSWKIEVSYDKKNWTLIDLRENDTSLNGYNRFSLFTCNKTSSNNYRYVKITGIQSHSNDSKFLLTEIEFYGSFQ